jgi:alanine racemase
MEPRLAGGYLTINLDALAHNYRLLADRSSPAECAAVVKADGYGLGAREVARCLREAGCRTFFVALPTEAARLREAVPDAAVFVLDGLLPEAAPAYVHERVDPVLNSLDEIRTWSAMAREHGPLSAALQIDSGMTRLGLSAREVEQLAAEPALLDGIEIAVVLSHLACADTPGHPMNEEQRVAFQAARDKLGDKIGAARACLANASGIFLGSDFHFDMVRPGVALYGANPTPDAANPMRQVVHLQGKILQVHFVDTNRRVGYGATHRMAQPGRIATVAVGYADGYLRSLGNRGFAAIDGIRIPVVGRVSMDLITLDVSDVPPEKAQPGKLVDLIGGGVPLDEIAALAGTIPYEMLTSLGPRYFRRFVGAGT